MAARGPEPATIGIDFGASKCCVAAARGGGAQVLEDALGQRATPAWVAFTAERRLVGGAALDQAVLNCANAVRDVKSTLGRTYDKVKDAPSACRIYKSDYPNKNTLKYSINYRKTTRQISPEQIAAMLLAKMKAVAEESLGCPVHQAVISVPASFGHAQRVALRAAAQVAGLEVLQLLNETTAAGVAFADNRTAKTPATIALVDFGASKLDVSLMEVRDKTVKVLAATGNQFLGGFGLDEALITHCIGLIRKKYGGVDRIDEKAKVKLRLACEKLKKTLSLLQEAPLKIESFTRDVDVDITVSRKHFYQLIEEDLRREIENSFGRLFKRTSMKKDSINKVVLMGGSTRIPVVKSIIEQYFGRDKLDQTVNADEAVAQGAALHAAALAGDPQGIHVVDVSSYVCFGQKCGKKTETLIPKFTPLPFTVSYDFDEKPGTEVHFFERTNGAGGNRCDTELGSVKFEKSYLDFMSSNIQVILTLCLDVNRLFSVEISGRDQSKVKAKPIVTYPSYVVNQWMMQEKEFQRDIEEEEKRVDAEVELESLCFELENELSNPMLDEHCTGYELDAARRSVSNALDWFNKNIDQAPKIEISYKIDKMKNVQKDAKRMVETAYKKVRKAEEEAARRQAEMEKLRHKISVYNSSLSETNHAVEDPVIERYSNGQELEPLKRKLSQFEPFTENIESASFDRVSQNFEELMQVRKEIDEFRVTAMQEKTRREKLTDFKALLFELKGVLNDLDLQTYSDPKEFEQCKEIVSVFIHFEEQIESAPLGEVLERLKTLTQLHVNIQQLQAAAKSEKAKKLAIESKERLEKISLFKACFSDIDKFLHSDIDSCWNPTVQLYKERLSFLRTSLQNLESFSLSEESVKLEELNKLKKEVDQLREKAEHMKARDEKGSVNTPASLSAKGNNHEEESSNSNYRNVALTSIINKNDVRKQKSSAISQSSENSSVSLNNGLLSPPEAEAKENGSSCQCRRDPSNDDTIGRSSSRSRSPSGSGYKDDRSTCRDFTSGKKETNISQRDRSSSRSRLTSVSVPTNAPQTSDSANERERKLPHRERSSSRPRHPQPSKSFGGTPTERPSPPSSSCRAEENTTNQMNSLSRVRSRSRDPKHNRSTGPSSSLGEGDDRQVSTNKVLVPQNHPTQKSNFWTGSGSHQPPATPSGGAPLDHMKQTALENNATLPSKNHMTAQRTSLVPPKMTSQESQTCTVEATNKSTQTDSASEHCSCCRNSNISTDDESTKSESKDLVKKFEETDVLSWLNMENVATSMRGCDMCSKLQFVCINHRTEAFSEVGKWLNAFLERLKKDQTPGTELGLSNTAVQRPHGSNGPLDDALKSSADIPWIPPPRPSSSTQKSSDAMGVPSLSSSEGPQPQLKSYGPVYTGARYNSYPIYYTSTYFRSSSTPQEDVGIVQKRTAEYEKLGSP